MDYNCRDYLSPTTTSSGPQAVPLPLPRHDSYQELEYRSRSPASFKAKFPLLRLPLELRQHIYSYLLPRTRELLDTNPATNYARARNSPAVQKPAAKRLLLPAGNAPSNVVWLRGATALLGVCQQLHDECAELLYGSNTFLLFLTFSGITFRFRWLLRSGLAPCSDLQFLEHLPQRYLCRVRKVIVNVDHVDSYTGMVKFNVGGKGLTHGLKRQVQRLVNALKAPSPAENEGEGTTTTATTELEPRRLTKLAICVSNSNATLDAIKAISTRESDNNNNKPVPDLEVLLEPFRQLYGVREVSVRGAVAQEFARGLESSMRSTDSAAAERAGRGVVIDAEDAGMGAPVKGVCVYGNDL
ncbi:hypothetical protein LTR08_006001 [Meristemomyces frigidus]|nr:hypothetical protein LTR08_006001 [Meristemomyces frigidus]